MALREKSWSVLMRARAEALKLGGEAEPRETDRPRRLTFVQYGDYADGFRRLARGEGATYYGQEYTVRHVGDVAARDDVESVHILTFSTDQVRDVMSNGVVTSGVDLYPKGKRARHAALIAATEATQPTHLIVAAPIYPLLRWGLRKHIPTLPLFLDSFRGDGLRVALRNRRLSYLLNHPAITLVANHNLASSLELARIGVDPAKIVPFDWPAIITAADFEPKPAPPADRPIRLLYVGMLMDTKGVGDAIDAVAALARKGRAAELTLIGKGDDATYRAQAERAGVADRVTFAGLRPHAEVLQQMHDHDVVLVPSHHAYPEGLPATLYESFCSRTPLVASDHPMFELRIKHRENALVHRERDPESLAACVLELASDASLYERLSRDSAQAAATYLCPLKWDELVSGFLRPDERQALLAHSLAATGYA